MFRKDGIFGSAIRTFILALSSIMGIGVGLILLILAIGGNDQIEKKTTAKILPDLKGERKALGTSGPVILQINISGVIGADGMKADKIASVLTESREGALKGDRVKAILLHVNSPGGVAFEAKSIYDLIKQHKEQYKIPVIAYVDGLCASGGMMIAAAADKIVANDGSLVGSVGVIMPPFFNVSEVLQKYDIKSLTLSRGKDKDAMNPFRPWKVDEANSLQPLIDYTYNIFVDIMTTNRPHLDKQKLISDYGAKVYPADVAAQLGYIDAAGYLPNKALALAVESAKLEEGEEYHVVQLSAKTWVSDLFDERSSLLQGKIVHQVQLNPELPPELMNKLLYLYLPSGS